ncbi:MAG TPA: DUF4157 domain-containing protein [Kofleriaceae bacterium]
MGFEREKRQASDGAELARTEERDRELELLRAKRKLAPGRRTLVDELPVRRDVDFRANAMHEVLGTIGAVARGERDGRVDGDVAMGETMWRVAERRAQTLHRRAVDHGEADPEDPAVAESLRRIGDGTRLPDAVKRRMEAEFGVSFDHVRVHTDGVAAQAAHAIHAEAFTVGEDIFFADGAFDPGSPAGERLLAHELTHVVQGMEGRIAAGGASAVSQPGDSLEREAEHRAAAISTRPFARAPREARNEGSRAESKPQRAPAAPATPKTTPAAAEAPAPAAVSHAPAAAAPIAHAPAPSVLMRKPAQTAADAGTFDVTSEPDPPLHLNIPVDHTKLHAAKQQLDHVTTNAKAQALAQTNAALHKSSAQHHDAGPTENHAAQLAELKHQPHHAAARHDTPAHHATAHAPQHGGGGGGGTGGIQFKAISDWNKLLPKHLPNQDERETKRLTDLVKKKVERDRKIVGKQLSGLRSAQMKVAAQLRGMKSSLQGQISGAQNAALGKVSSAEAAQVASVQSTISGLRARVRAAESAAVSAADQAHQQAVQQMDQAFEKANQKLTQDHDKATQKLQSDTSKEQSAVAEQFENAENQLRAYGAQKAGEASALGNMALPYSGKQLSAARKAAQQVASKYAAAMPENANQAAEQIGKNLGDAQQAVTHTSTEFQSKIDDAFQQATQALQHQHQSMVTAANQAHTQAVTQLHQSANAAATALSALESKTVSGLHTQAAGARSSISSAGAAAIAGVGSACDSAATSVAGGADAIIKSAAKMEDPDPATMGRTIATAHKQLSQGASAAAAGLRKTAGSSAASLEQQASSAASSLAQAAQAANQAATQQATAAEQGLQKTAETAKQTQQKIGQDFIKTATQLTQQTEQQLSQLNSSAESAFSAMTTALQGKLATFVSGCKTKFDAAVPTKEKQDILANAAKAAASVPKHWWQSVIAFVVKVVIAVAIGVAVGALIVATGGVGGILLAVAIGAAGGALGYTASLVAGNLIEGKSAFADFSWKGLAIGAIAGGITGGAGSWLSGAAEGAEGGFLGAFGEEASGLGNFAIKSATDFTVGMASDAAAQLIVTGHYSTSLEDVLLQAATAGIGNSSKLVSDGASGGTSDPAADPGAGTGGGTGTPSVDTGGDGAHASGGDTGGTNGGTTEAKSGGATGDHSSGETGTGGTDTGTTGKDTGTTGKDTGTDGKDTTGGNDDGKDQGGDKDQSGDKDDGKDDKGGDKDDKGKDKPKTFDKDKFKDKLHESLHPEKRSQWAEAGATPIEKGLDNVLDDHRDKERDAGKEKKEEEEKDKELDEHAHPEMPELNVGGEGGGGGGGEGGGSATDQADEKDGYKNASPAARSAAEGALRSGQKPAKNDLRDTEANQRGLASLTKAQQSLKPEEKADFNQKLADTVANKPEPTGTLDKDVAETNKAEKAAEKTKAKASARANEEAKESDPTSANTPLRPGDAPATGDAATGDAATADAAAGAGGAVATGGGVAIANGARGANGANGANGAAAKAPEDPTQASGSEGSTAADGSKRVSPEEVLRQHGMSDEDIAVLKKALTKDAQESTGANNLMADGAAKDALTPDEMKLVIKAHDILLQDVREGQPIRKFIPNNSVGGVLQGETVYNGKVVPTDQMRGDIALPRNTDGMNHADTVAKTGLDYEHNTHAEHAGQDRAGQYTDQDKAGNVSLSQEVAQHGLHYLEMPMSAEQASKAQVPLADDLYKIAQKESATPERYRLKPRDGGRDNPYTGTGATAPNNLRGFTNSINQELNAGSHAIVEGAHLKVRSEVAGADQTIATYTRGADGKLHWTLSPELHPEQRAYYQKLIADAQAKADATRAPNKPTTSGKS